MPYAITDPLNCLTTASLAVGPRIWYHESADTGAQAQVDGFITDGVAKGLSPGDLLYHKNTATNIVTSHLVFASTTAPTTAVDLGDATVAFSGTNSD